MWTDDETIEHLEYMLSVVTIRIRYWVAIEPKNEQHSEFIIGKIEHLYSLINQFSEAIGKRAASN